MIAQDLQILETWLGQPWPNGVIAAGGCSADHQPFHRMIGSDHQPRLKDEFWLTLHEAVSQLAAYGCGDGRAMWVFEGAVLHLAARPDGAWAAAMIPREVSAAVQNAVQTRLREFVSMVE